jgi:hypothetical protein
MIYFRIRTIPGIARVFPESPVKIHGGGTPAGSSLVKSRCRASAHGIHPIMALSKNLSECLVRDLSRVLDRFRIGAKKARSPQLHNKSF